jgi:prophage regulatory protein
MIHALTSNSLAVPRRALRMSQVIEKTGLSKTQIYRLLKQGKFPKFHNLSQRAKAADEREIDEWLAEKFAK